MSATSVHARSVAPGLIAALIALGICNHVAYGGSRIAVSLFALKLGTSPFIVGTLMSMLALLPMLFAVRLGRWGDRIGVRRPMLAGVAAIVIGTLLPVVAPGLPTLYCTVVLTGAGYTAWQVSLQHWLGTVALPERRAAHFAYLALGLSLSNMAGPVITGLAIDHFGHRYAFGVLAAFAAASLLALTSLVAALPKREGALPAREHRVWDLLTARSMRRIFLASALISVAWDLHTFVVPILGTQRGFSATQIGVVLGGFGAATVVVRAAVPWLNQRMREWTMVSWSIGIGLVVYALYPFAPNLAAMAGLSFLLGLGLGATQPNMMALLHKAAPPERIGEAVGLRLSVVNASHVALPLAFGAAGTALGVVPVFWAMAAMLAAGGWCMRKVGH
ncbi:MAG TPA: MFS transporter [Burkholderiaceae bacterium]|nr:MFS transporter [Burkholderiaceae bacterium]